MTRGVARRALLVASLLPLAGCQPPAPVQAPAAAAEDPAARPEGMRWLPADDDMVYAYKTFDLEAKTEGVLMLRVRRTGPARIELLGGRRPERLVYKPEGIVREAEGTFLLRTPAVEGKSWPGGPSSTFRIARVGHAEKLAAGSFDRCLDVVDQRSGAIQGTVTMTFCAEVGLVRIETEGAGPGGSPPIHERVELRSYGKAVDINAPR